MLSKLGVGKEAAAAVSTSRQYPKASAAAAAVANSGQNNNAQHHAAAAAAAATAAAKAAHAAANAHAGAAAAAAVATAPAGQVGGQGPRPVDPGNSEGNMTDDLNAAALGGIYPAEGARNLQFAQMLDQLQVTSEEGGAQKRPEAYEPPVDRTSPAVGASERAMPQKGVRADLTVEPDKTEGLLTAEQIQLLFALQEHQAKSGKDVDMPGQLGMPLEQIINIVNHYADPRFIVRPTLDEDRPPVPELESKSRSTLPEL
eukprot:gene13276-25205_t